MNKFLMTALLLTGSLTLAQSTSTPTTTETAPATTAPATTAPSNTAPATLTPAAPTATSAPAVTDPATPVAQIGSEVVTLGDFNRDFNIAVARVVNEQGMPFDQTVLTQFGSARPEFLKQYIRNRALLQLARAAGQPDAAAVDAEVTKAKANFKTDDEFKQALSETGYTDEAAFRQYIEQQELVRNYLSNLQKRFTFSDSMVNTFYSLHKNEFMSEAEACVKHILVADKAAADAIMKDLAGGKDFAQIAKEQSKDPGSAAQGGDLGCIAPGDTVPAFDKASFSGPLNEAQLVQSEYGWHIVVVTKRTAAGQRSLQEMAPLIREQLSRDAAQKYLDSQIDKITVKSFPEVVTVPAAPQK